MVNAGEAQLPVSHSLRDFETAWPKSMSPELSCIVATSQSTGFNFFNMFPDYTEYWQHQRAMMGGLKMLWEHYVVLLNSPIKPCKVPLPHVPITGNSNVIFTENKDFLIDTI